MRMALPRHCAHHVFQARGCAGHHHAAKPRHHDEQGPAPRLAGEGVLGCGVGTWGQLLGWAV